MYFADGERDGLYGGLPVIVQARAAYVAPMD